MRHAVAAEARELHDAAADLMHDVSKEVSECMNAAADTFEASAASLSDIVAQKPALVAEKPAPTPAPVVVPVPAPIPEKPATDIAALSALQDVLKHVDWKHGIHHDLVSATTIVDTKHGRFAGVILDANTMLVSAQDIHSENPIQVVKDGEPYKVKPKWNAAQDHDLKMTYDHDHRLALVQFPQPIFDQQFALPISSEPIQIHQPLFVCGNPQPSLPRTRDGGTVLEVLPDGNIILGVPASPGYHGGLVTHTNGQTVGVIVGSTDKKYSIRTSAHPEKEISVNVLIVKPLVGHSVEQIRQMFD